MSPIKAGEQPIFDVHILPINQMQPKQISADELTKLLKS